MVPNARGSQASSGFTLIEITVATAVLGVALMSITQLFLSSSEAFSSSTKRAQLTIRSQVVMNRLCDEIITGRFLTLTPPNPTASDRLRFDKIIGFASGEPVYGNPVQIELVLLEGPGGPGSNGIDDNGNGLIDEGAVLIWEDFPPQSPVTPGPEDVQTIIVMNVAKDGLSFTRMGAMLAIDLTLQAVAEPGVDPVSHTLRSGIRMRNP